MGAAVLDLGDKVVLVSLRRISNVGDETFDTFFGRVVSYNENTIIVTRKNGQQISLPYDDDIYRKAEPGVYELKDGENCEDPDFIAEWTVFESEEASIKYRTMNAPSENA